MQKSLQQSVKALVESKIREHDVGDYFDIKKTHIETHGDGIIIFEGMQNHTADSIKSFEGFRIAWFEEAHRASNYSLGLLRPTIRAKGSELWFSWNPRSKKDPIDKFLRGDEAYPDSCVVEANYRDNPWFRETELYHEMLADKRRDPDRYAHVWLGRYQTQSEARVFRNWRTQAFETPHDARFYFGADWGFSIDPTVLIRCFIVGRTMFVDQEVWKVGCEIDHIPALFAGSDTRTPPRWANPYGWQGIPGSMKWPLRADSANPQAISYLRRHGFENITPSVKGAGSVEEGVEFLKTYDIIVHPRCEHVIDELSTYSYAVDKQTEEVIPVLADRDNHTIDALRYAIESLRMVVAQPVFATYGSGR